jgi:hypothetical protein
VSDPTHPTTARMSFHARQRCAEMRIETKRVKRLLRCADIIRVSYNDRFIAVGDSDPKIAVVYARDPDGTIVVVTVLFRDYEHYDRETYTG